MSKIRHRAEVGSVAPNLHAADWRRRHLGFLTVKQAQIVIIVLHLSEEESLFQRLPQKDLQVDGITRRSSLMTSGRKLLQSGINLSTSDHRGLVTHEEVCSH